MMEYAETDLCKIMEKKKKMTVSEVRKYSYQILMALIYLKENKVTHRDLKPQNILFHNQNVKLCDFGFAKQMA